MQITDEMVDRAAQAIVTVTWKRKYATVPADLWDVLKTRPSGEFARLEARAALEAALSGRE